MKLPMNREMSALPTIMPPEQHELRYWRTYSPKIPVEQTTVEGLRHNRAAGQCGARHIAAIVWVFAARNELHVGSCTQIIDHYWPGAKIGISQFAIGPLPDQCAQISIGLFCAVIESGGTALIVAGNPKCAGRSRASAANLI